MNKTNAWPIQIVATKDTNHGFCFSQYSRIVDHWSTDISARAKRYDKYETLNPFEKVAMAFLFGSRVDSI